MPAGTRHMNIRVPGLRTMGGHDAYATRGNCGRPSGVGSNDRRPAARRAGGCHADGVDGGVLGGTGRSRHHVRRRRHDEHRHWERQPTRVTFLASPSRRTARSWSAGPRPTAATPISPWCATIPTAPSTRASTRWQSDHGLRRCRRCRLRRRRPGGRQDRGRRVYSSNGSNVTTSRWCATTPTAPWTRASTPMAR